MHIFLPLLIDEWHWFNYVLSYSFKSHFFFNYQSNRNFRLIQWGQTIPKNIINSEISFNSKFDLELNYELSNINLCTSKWSKSWKYKIYFVVRFLDGGHLINIYLLLNQ